MPELPEVETVVRQLGPLLTGRRARRLEILDAKLGMAEIRFPAGCTIGTVERLGKQVLIGFDFAGREPGDDRRWLCVHLRMTGRLIWSVRPEASTPPLRARLEVDDGWLLFKDARRFGTMRMLERTVEAIPKGVDPMSSAFTPEELGRLLSGSRQEIKPWLLRQDRLVGMGNIYAAESLFLARLSPSRRGGTLSKEEIRRLHDAIQKTLRMGIRLGGTTFSDFQNARGENGKFQRRLAVYGKEAAPCPQCRTPIGRIAQQGRSTFYCPRCQGGE